MTSPEDPPEDPVPVTVVGVGASAGGIEAFRSLLEGLPPSPGCAIVLVVHLEPKSESHLAEMLAADTDLPVEQAADGTRLEADHVYVAPPGQTVTVVDGRLRVRATDRRSDEPPRVVDDFLASLADEAGDRAVGIVLSGNLSDGTEGLRAIRAAGGHALVQDPGTAEHDQMPRSAIENGLADAVLPPAELGAEVADRVGDPLFGEGRGQPPAPGDLGGDQGDLDRVLELLEDRAGIDFTHYRKGTLKRRIQRQILASSVEGLEGYVELVESDPDALDDLYEDVLIGVTAFFRNEEMYDDLREHVFPELLEDRHAGEPLRIWVPGCATGEEAYSIAIALERFLDDVESPPQVQIFGTDVDADAIQTARAGWYPDDVEEDVPGEVLDRFFTRASGGYEVDKAVRGRCIFAVHDLARDPPFSQIDLVSCRNLLIYLEPGLQKRVLGALHYALRPDGFLVLAEAESTARADELFDQVLGAKSVHRPREVSPSPIQTWTDLHPRVREEPETGQVRGQRTVRNTEDHVDAALLDLYGPAAVVVNRDDKVVSFRGETGRYLEHDAGEADLQIRHLLRRGLAVPVMQGLREAREKGASHVLEGLPVEGSQGPDRVDVEIRPLASATGREDNLLVVFRAEEDRDESQEGLVHRVLDRVGSFLGVGGDDGLEREELERELERTRQELRTIAREYEATNEELRAAHEEALSTNEELQSTNEELETAKEELQSSNEELTTLNQELQERSDEIQRINDDLRNLLESVDLPIVMVDSEVSIRRFTNRAEDTLNLIPSDVGRPLADIRTGFDVGSLETTVIEVLDTFQEKTVLLDDEAGRSYAVKVRPYRTTDDRVGGAVLVFLDPSDGDRKGS